MLGQDPKLPALTNLAKVSASFIGIAKSMYLSKPAKVRNCQPRSAEIFNCDYKKKSLKRATAFSDKALKKYFQSANDCYFESEEYR